MRRWVGPLQLMLALASAVILRLESRGTHDHIYCLRFEISPTWRVRSPYLYPPNRNRVTQLYPGIGFPFRGLLRLAGLRWRYWTPPPKGITNSNDIFCLFVIPRRGLPRKHGLSIVEKACLLTHCLLMDVLFLCELASARMCLPSRCLAMGLYVIIPNVNLIEELRQIPFLTYCTSSLPTMWDPGRTRLLPRDMTSKFWNDHRARINLSSFQFLLPYVAAYRHYVQN
jgi:hypothetical protein